MDTLYLPIANIEVLPLAVVVIGLLGGIVSSFLGIGSGIVITPALILLGIPSSTAIVTQLVNAASNNFSGMLFYWKKQDVDLSLGFYVFVGGCVGAFIEFKLLAWREPSLFNIIFLKVFGIVLVLTLSFILFSQAFSQMKHHRSDYSPGFTMRSWMIYFPFHKVFKRTRTEISILVPLLVGAGTGLLTSSLGGSISLLVSPILTYLIGRISRVVTGTTLIASVGINVFVAFLYGSTVIPPDFILLSLLFFGGIMGNQMGGRFSYLIPRSILGFSVGITLLVVCGYFVLTLLDAIGKSVTHRLFINHFKTIVETLSSSKASPWLTSIVDYAHSNPFHYTLWLLGIFLTLSFITNKIFHKLLPTRDFE